MAVSEHKSQPAGRPRRTRALLNLLLVAFLLFQMTRQFLPGPVHEAAGIAFIALVVAHNAIAWRWYAGLARGRWGARRALVTVVDLALVAVFVGVAACGLGMSGIAVSLGVAGHTMQLRSAHIALTHLGFLLTGVHLGMHAMPAARKAAHALSERMVRAAARAAGLALAALAAAYGAFAFVKLDFAGYITMRTRFAFIDPDQSVALFVLDHLAVLVLSALAGLALAALTTKRVPGKTKGRA